MHPDRRWAALGSAQELARRMLPGGAGASLSPGPAPGLGPAGRESRKERWEGAFLSTPFAMVQLQPSPTGNRQSDSPITAATSTHSGFSWSMRRDCATSASCQLTAAPAFDCDPADLASTAHAPALTPSSGTPVPLKPHGPPLPEVERVPFCIWPWGNCGLQSQWQPVGHVGTLP